MHSKQTGARVQQKAGAARVRYSHLIRDHKVKKQSNKRVFTHLMLVFGWVLVRGAFHHILLSSAAASASRLFDPQVFQIEYNFSALSCFGLSLEILSEILNVAANNLLNSGAFYPWRTGCWNNMLENRCNIEDSQGKSCEPKALLFEA